MRTATRVVLALFALGAAGVVAWQLLRREAPDLVELATEVPQRVVEAIASAPPFEPAPDAAEPETPPIEHPVEADLYSTLPTLDGSDPEFLAALSTLIDAAQVDRHLERSGLIRRLVVSLDNLPGGRVTLKQRPLKAVGGALVVRGEEGGLVLDERNFARYVPLVELAERLDPAALVAVYRRFYPLFQQAYQDLGYPDGYFNDRLVAVIDHLLAAPPATGELRLVQPNVLYRYADPALEARSPGAKILLRIGPDNAERVKAVLVRWRAVLIGGSSSLPHT